MVLIMCINRRYLLYSWVNSTSNISHLENSSKKTPQESKKKVQTETTEEAAEKTSQKSTEPSLNFLLSGSGVTMRSFLAYKDVRRPRRPGRRSPRPPVRPVRARSMGRMLVVVRTSGNACWTGLRVEVMSWSMFFRIWSAPSKKDYCLH